jgi:transcriptional regulator with XRE-family HTH domain
MPRTPTLKLPPLKLGKETLGQRIARLRKERGYTQVELADRMGLVQGLVSDYEREKLRPHAEMVVRFAIALEVTTDELLGLKKIRTNGTISNRRLLRRLKQIEQLPKKSQDTILQTIDFALKAQDNRK